MPLHPGIPRLLRFGPWLAVDGHHPVAATQETHQVATEEAGGSGDHDARRLIHTYIVHRVYSAAPGSTHRLPRYVAGGVQK